MICTNSQLSEAVSKLVVFGLDRYVDVADVYSSEIVGKSSVYDRIKRKHGDKNSYVVIGTVESKEQAQQVRFSKDFFHELQQFWIKHYLYSLDNSLQNYLVFFYAKYIIKNG